MSVYFRDNSEAFMSCSSRPESVQSDERNAALREQFDEIAQTDNNVYLVTENELFGGAPWDRADTDENPTVGGTHPSDLGEYDMALFYQDYLSQLLDGAA